MKIIIIQRLFPIYRKAIFDKLNKEYSAKIFHGTNATGIKQTTTAYSFPVKLAQYSKRESLSFIFGFREMIKIRPNIIFHEFTIGVVSLIPVRIVSFFLGSKFILWGHNINLKRGFKPFSNLADFYRYLLMKSSHGILFYTPDQMVPVEKYIKKEKLFVAYNALNTDIQLENYNRISRSSREKVKKDLNINTEFNLIFISRLLPAKRPEQIIEIYSLLNADIRNSVGIHIIGNGPMFQPLQTMIDESGYSNNIKLYGEITDEPTLGQFLYISDFMINPGYLGLSVNLSFAYGCPIITFDNIKMDQMHSPEIYYLKDGFSGIKIKNLNLLEMANALSEALTNGTYIRMRENCLQTIYTQGSIQQMFGGFEKIINYVTRENGQ